MFSGCSLLTSIDVSGFKTDNVTDMTHMFSNCFNLRNIDVSGFNTDHVTIIFGMFYYDYSLNSLDLSGFNTENVTNMAKMFYNCSGLKVIYVGDKWSTSAATENGADMFSWCANLVGGKGTVYSPDHTDISYAHIDGGEENPGYFTRSGDDPYLINMPYAVLEDNDEEVTIGEATVQGKTLTFYYDKQKEERGGISVKRGWENAVESITTVVFDESFANYTELTSTANWFNGCSNLKEIKDIRYLKTDSVTNMSGMFYKCYSLTDLDLSSFNTDKVTSMYSMLAYCSNLANLDVSNFNTSKVTSMWELFFKCSSLTSIDLHSFNTTEVTTMSNMFEECSQLSTLDLSSFNTSNVTDFRWMFKNCSNLATIYVGEGWTTEKADEDLETFAGCSSLIGGQGTVYTSEFTGYEYARVDDPTNGNPGYFTDVNDKNLEMGDVNGDGDVNIADATTMISKILSEPIEGRFITNLADMNSDNEIDILDVTLVVNKVLTAEGNEPADDHQTEADS
jgi:surface protein